MTRVEFIKLHKQEKAKLLCELAELFFEQGRRVLVTVQDDNQGVTLDRFMWAWQKGSFVPHAFDNSAVDCLDDPVVITCEERNANGARVLVMGKPCSIPFMRQFEMVIDFAELYDEELKIASRNRFAQYKEARLDTAMRE